VLHYSRAAEYGMLPLRDHIEQSNREVLLSVSIEDLQALEEIDTIASTEGIDVIMVGPVDLSRALEVVGQAHHPKLIAAIDRISEAVRRGGQARLSISVGHQLFPRTATQLREMGVGYANCAQAPEVRLLESMSRQTAEIRGELGLVSP
jgi:2-keto-3-deoxy-L-rhamnonate aldolase RhmA